MERLTRSNPRHSRLFSRARALLPFLDVLSPLSVVYIPLRWTKCVSPVAVYTASTTVSPLLLPTVHPLDGPGRLSSFY